MYSVACPQFVSLWQGVVCPVANCFVVACSARGTAELWRRTAFAPPPHCGGMADVPLQAQELLLAFCRLVGCLQALVRFCSRQVHSGHPIMSGNCTRRPASKLVLSFEQEIRKKAYQQVRLDEAKSLAAALEEACKSPELLSLHFLMPLTTSTGFLSVAADDMPGPDQWFGRGKGKGKGKFGKGKDGKFAKKFFLKTKTDDGKSICFKFNNGKCSDPSVCGFVHVCQLCLAPGHGKKQCPHKQSGDKHAPDVPAS